MAHLLKKDGPPKKKQKKGKKKKVSASKKTLLKNAKKKKSILEKPNTVFSSKKLHMDARSYIQFSELNQKCMDAFFATKKRKHRMEINIFQRSGGNQLTYAGSISYMDIAYLVLEMYEGTEFPYLNLIKDPFKKAKQAIVRVGSKEDNLPEEIQKRDLEVILKDLPDTERGIVCYRVRKRVYERLMHHYMWEMVPVFPNQRLQKIKASSILFPLQATNNGNRNFFCYLIGGHLMLKNGDCYRLTSVDQGFQESSLDIGNLGGPVESP